MNHCASRAARALACIASVAASTGASFGQVCLYHTKSFFDDGFGTVLRSAGDVDGDGVADWIAGAPYADLLVNNGGAVRVHSGADGAVLFEIHGTEENANLGQAVDGAGDVDGDGVRDFVCGAPESKLGGNGAGTVVVYSGANADTLYQLTGPVGSRYGWSVAGLGDIDGDGHAEFAVGAPYEDAIGTDSGTVRIHSGADGHVLKQWNGNPGDNLGRVVANAGDVNGDGKPDLLVTAQWQANGGPEGYARVYSGANFAILRTFTPPVFDQDGWFGAAAAGLGDVNGDGRGDVAIASPFSPVGGSYAGEVFVYSGANGALLHDFVGTAGSRFGTSVAGVGDVNGDGRADLLVGAPELDTPVVDAGTAYVLSGVDGAPLFTLVGEQNGQRVGSSVCGPGDLDGDAQPDFLVGERRAILGYASRPDRVNYCVGAPNSTGDGATIGSAGSTSISQADFELTATGCPPGVFGLFFFGAQQQQVPFGDGYLCILPKLTRLPTVQADTVGDVRTDLFGHGVAEALIDPGETWNFQLWYRDPFGPLGTGSNASDAMYATFCP